MGNSVVRNRETPDKLETEGNLNLTDLASRFDTGAYLTPHSDIVALMVLEHQTHMSNLITRVGFEARMALHQQAGINQALKRPPDEMSESTRRRIGNAVEEMLDYMLFLEETPLRSPVKGTSGFARVFSSRGPRDSRNRSLRELDLETRLFRYPLSYMIYTEAFDEMPTIARDRLWRRLWEVLTGHDNNARFARLTAADRKAILEILRDTKKNLPAYWTDQA